MISKSDILIIGGGIAGGSLAAKIAPHASVTLLEAEANFAYHSTGRSAAMWEPFYGHDIIRKLCWASEAELVARDVLTPRGVLYLYEPNGPRETFDVMLSQPGAERLSVADAVALVPILRPEVFSEAALGSKAQDIDVDKLLQCFLREARAAGATLVTNARVNEIHRDEHWIVDTDAGSFVADIIVNAAGAWADLVAKLAGVAPMNIQPKRRSMARIPAPGGHDVSGWPMVVSASEDWYAKPDAGKLLVSPADQDPIDAMDAWPDDMVLAEGIARYEAFVTEPVTRVETTWAGLRSFPPDNVPVVGFDPTVAGFFWVAGQGGFGIETSPAMSDIAAALLQGKSPAVDANIVAALSPARFE